jgi:hypothetical protein
MAQLMYQCHHADKGLLYQHTQGMNMTNKTSASAADPMNGIFPFWLLANHGMVVGASESHFTKLVISKRHEPSTASK